MDVITILAQLPNDKYVPPVSLKLIGAWAKRQEVAFDEQWPASVRIGWIRQNNAQADAQTNAYLVGVGVAQ